MSQYLNFQIENTSVWDYIYQLNILSTFIMHAFIIIIFLLFFFFDRAKIVWRCQCVKQPNWNKVYIDDINNKRGHRNIQNFFNRCWRKKNIFIVRFYMNIDLYIEFICLSYWFFIGCGFLLFSLYKCNVNVSFCIFWFV